MKQKKLQIFVSSTFIDLKEERQAAVEAILSSGHIPAGMELFAAGDESQLTVIKRWIDESDVYLLILGGRYGSIEKNSGKSYTHLEYEYALEKKKPLFAVVIKPEALDEKVRKLGKSALEQENPRELNNFRIVVLNNLVKFWDDRKDIKIAIHETLSEFDSSKELLGWVRSDQNVNTGFLAEEIARLTNENFQLRNKLASNPENDNALYSNLTYYQLASLLRNEKINFNNSDINCLEYLIGAGPQLSTSNGIKGSNPAIEKLVVYKLVIEIGGLTTFLYRFTEDGHNFFIKTLYYSSLPDNENANR